MGRCKNISLEVDKVAGIVSILGTP